MLRKKKLSPRKKAKQGRSKNTVQSIIEATTRIIEQSGVENLSTNQVAKVAGISIGSLYQYFPSKDAILISLVERELNAHVEKIQAHIEQMQGEDLDTFIDEILKTILLMLERKKKVRYFLFKFMPRGLMSSINDVEDQIQSIIYKKLKSYPELKHKADLNLTSYIIVHSVIGVVLSHLGPGREFDREVIFKELSLLIRGYLFYDQRGE